MKHIFLVILIAFCSSSIMAQNPAWDPSYDPTHNWNWTNSSWWLASGFPDPFTDPHAVIGIDISEDAPCAASRGWELYQRRLFLGDVGPSFSATPQSCVILDPNVIASIPLYGGRQDRAFFCLYNRYSGVLRFFLYRPATAIANPAQCIRTSIYIKDGSNMRLKHCLFNSLCGRTLESSSVPLLPSEANIVQLSEEVTSAAWLVVDIRMDYDPTLQSDATNNQSTTSIPSLTIQISNELVSVSELALQINGTAVGKKAVVVGSNNTLSGALNTAWSKRGDIKKSMSSTRDGISNLEKDLNSMNFTDLATAVGSLAYLANPIGAVVGAIPLLKSFFNLGDKRKMEIVYDTSVINLSADGTISTIQQDPAGSFEVGLAGSRFAQSGAIPYFVKVNGRDKKLGLYCLKRNPKVQVDYRSAWYNCPSGGDYMYWDYYPSIIDPTSDIICFNPLIASKIKVSDAKYGFMVRGKYTEAYAGSDVYTAGYHKMPMTEATIISRSSNPSEEYSENVTIVSGKLYPIEHFMPGPRFMITGYDNGEKYYVTIYNLFEYTDPSIASFLPYIEVINTYNSTPFVNSIVRGVTGNYMSGTSLKIDAIKSVIVNATFQAGAKAVLRSGYDITFQSGTTINAGADVSASIHYWGDDPLAKCVVNNNIAVDTQITVSDAIDANYSFAVYNNRPNPFNPSTTIEYTLPGTAKYKSLYNVTASILNTSGKIIRKLEDRKDVSTGRYFIKWDGKDNSNKEMPSGVYFCMVNAGNLKKMIKMTMVR